MLILVVHIRANRYDDVCMQFLLCHGLRASYMSRLDISYFQSLGYCFFLCFCKKCRLFHMKDFTNFIFFTVVNQALQHCDDHLMQLKNLVSDLHPVLICFYSFSCCDFFRRHWHYFRQAPHQLQEQPKNQKMQKKLGQYKNYGI